MNGHHHAVVSGLVALGTLGGVAAGAIAPPATDAHLNLILNGAMLTTLVGFVWRQSAWQQKVTDRHERIDEKLTAIRIDLARKVERTECTIMHRAIDERIARVEEPPRGP